MKRVALVLPNFSLGGAERQMVELARAVREQGWQPTLLVFENKGPLLDQVLAEKIPIIDLQAELWHGLKSPRFWTNVLRTMARIRAHCRADRTDVLQSFLYWQNQIALPARLFSRYPRVVVTGRRSMGDFKDGRAHYQWIENLTNPLSDAIVGNSQRVLEDCRRRERLRPAQLHAIPNGVNVARFQSATPADLRREFPALADCEAIIGTVGNLKTEKRQDIFLRTLAAVRRDHPRTGGVIVGRDMGEGPALRALAAELGLGDAIQFAGEKPDPASYHRAFDIFLLTSDEEGMPNAVLEAMASARPVVSTDVGGIREIIEDSVSGRVAPINDVPALAAAVGEFCANPTRAAAFGAAALRRMESEYSPAALARRYIELWERLLSR